jgi:hypothetical protein
MAWETGNPDADNADPYFDNGPIGESDLQIGDHLVFYNSHIFSLISKSEWSLENSVVIDVDSDLSTGGIRRGELHLQGHGTSEKKYVNYLKEVVLPLDEALNQVRDAITAAVGHNASVTQLDWNGNKGLLVRWEPYEPFAPPGAWWIRVELSPGATLADTQAAILGSIVNDPNPGTGYKPPPSASAVYFPLFRPVFHNWWTGYLEARRSNQHVKVRSKLEAYKCDGAITPGLFFKGQGKPIPVLRPRVAEG